MKKLPLPFSLSLIVLFLLLISSSGVFAQCGTEMTKEEHAQYLQHLEAYKKASSTQKIAAGEIMYIPVTFHVITKDDGTGGVELDQILEGIKYMNLHFGNAEIQFYTCGPVNYVPSTGMYDYVDSVSTSHLPTTYDVAETINIIYHNTLYLSGFGYAGGFAYYPGGPLRIHMSRSSDKYTLAHEMGHFWGLPHTFNNSANTDLSLRELVTRGTGANCTTAGDAICDTPADPYVHKESKGYFQDCIYTDTLYDSNGDRFAPMLNNVMSYYAGCNTETFTTGQMDVVSSYKTTSYRSVWKSTCAGIAAPTNLMATADEKYGLVLTWNDNASGELGYILEVSEGNTDNFRAVDIFPENTQTAIWGDLNSYTQYYFRVKPLATAGSHSNTAQFMTGKVYCFSTNTNNCQVPFLSINGEPALIGIQSVRLEGETLLNNVTGCSENGFGFFNQTVTQLYKGMNYRLDVGQLEQEFGSAVPYFYAWIDLNDDGIFDNASEKLSFSYHPSNSNHQITDLHFDQSVPAGIKRMRIRAIYGSNTNLTACESTSYGETEDYLIEIKEKPTSFPLQLAGTYDNFYGINLTWTNSAIPSGTQCIIYIDKGAGFFSSLDTVMVDNLGYYSGVFTNGQYSYLIRNLSDNSLLSDIVTVDVSGIRYCAPTNTSNCEQSNFTINGFPALIGIKSVTLDGETVLDNTTGCSQNGFHFFHEQVTQVYKGINYNLKVGQLLREDGNTVPSFNAWIDLNDDGNFDDATEKWNLEHELSTPYYYSTTLNFDPSVTPGIKRMRIRASTSNDSDLSACETTPYGETEDYLIEISDKPSSFPVQLAAAYDNTNKIHLSWTNTSIPSGTECVIMVDEGSGFSRLDTVLIDDLNYYSDVFANGDFAYILRNAADNSLLTNIATVNISNITYCIPAYSSECPASSDFSISQVDIFGETFFSNASGCSLNGFENYSESATTLYKGVPYTIDVKQRVVNGGFMGRSITAWVDFNNNGSFEDEGERFILKSSPKFATYTGTIFVPSTATAGPTTLRVRIHYLYSTISSCQYTESGETEDYNVTIADLPASLPVSLTATQEQPYLNNLTWAYTNIPDGTLAHIYRYAGGQNLILAETVTIDDLTRKNLIGSNGDYKYFIRKASDNSLLSNVANIQVYNYQPAYQLSGAFHDNVIRVSWDVKDVGGTEKALLYRTVSSNTSFFIKLDTVMLNKGFYDDIKYHSGDTEFVYFIRSVSGDTLSNKATVAVNSYYCIPSFNNTTCLSPLSTDVSYFSNGTFNYLFNSPYCYNNSFTEPSYTSKVDTLSSEVQYSFFFYFEGNCTDNVPTVNFRNVSVFLDYDHNGSFSPDEVVYANPAGEYSCVSFFDYTLPANAPKGLTRMRYIITDKDYPINDACGTYEVGTGYDFYVYIDNKLITGNDNKVPKKQSLFYAYPNPSENGRFSIHGEEEVTRVTIYRVTGETVYDGSPNVSAPLQPGMYILELYTAKGVVSEKVRFLSR